MSQAPRPQPLWIGEREPAFAMFHIGVRSRARVGRPGEDTPASETDAASSAPAPTAVLMCPPLGWEEMCSYPVRREWAQRLAAAGHDVLRVDLPGTGQSAGMPRDPDRLGAWLEAIADAAAWLRVEKHAERVAALGIGLGALLALRAAGEGAAIDELVAWGMPASGRALTRRIAAFARLQSGAGEERDEALAEGWIQSGGYALSAETVAALTRLKPDGTSPGGLRRVLLLREDDVAARESLANESLTRELSEAGVEVRTSPGPGYAAMMESPERSETPEETIATIGEWLTEADTVGERVASAASTISTDSPRMTARHVAQNTPWPRTAAAAEELRIEVDGTIVRERPFTVRSESGGTIFGILAEPLPERRGGLCVVCLPAWAERCTGPSRLWVELARRHAARGVSVLRTDLLSIGDSDGEREAMRDIEAVWDHERIAQVRAVLDALGSAGHGERFLLVGLCSGGYWAQQTAALDERVAGVLSLNPSVTPTGKKLLQQQAARRALAITSPAWWRRVARGEVSASGFKTVYSGVRVRVARRVEALLRARGGGEAPPPKAAAPTITELIDRIQARGARLTIGVSPSERSWQQLEVEGIGGAPERWPALRLHMFPSRDHNLRSMSDQAAIQELADELVGQAVNERAGEAATSIAPTI